MLQTPTAASKLGTVTLRDNAANIYKDRLEFYPPGE